MINSISIILASEDQDANRQKSADVLSQPISCMLNRGCHALKSFGWILLPRDCYEIAQIIVGHGA